METDYDNIIISNIREILDEKGIKHSKVAENLGLSQSSFSSLLAGQRVLHARYIPIIAKTLGCTCDDIFQIPDDKKRS